MPRKTDIDTLMRQVARLKEHANAEALENADLHRENAALRELLAYLDPAEIRLEGLNRKATRTLWEAWSDGTIDVADVHRLRRWAVRIAKANGRNLAWVRDVRAAQNCAGEEFLPEVAE